MRLAATVLLAMLISSAAHAADAPPDPKAQAATIARLSAVVAELQRERDDAVEARDALARSLATISPEVRNSVTLDQAQKIMAAQAQQATAPAPAPAHRP
jgi:hypothetical protein